MLLDANEEGAFDGHVGGGTEGVVLAQPRV